MDKNKDNLSGNQEKSDVFSTPEIEIKQGFKKTFQNWTKRNIKVIVPVGIIILLIIVLFIFINSHKSDLFPPELNSNYVKNYHAGLESNIEFILLNLHNDIPVPDSVEFNSDSIKFIRKDITETLTGEKLKKRLSEMGFVYSIVIDVKSFKDLDIESWIYRANYNDNEKNLVYAEFVLDFTNRDNIITLKSLELNYEHFKSIEIPVTETPKDTSKKPVKKDSLLTADSISKMKKDTTTKLKEKDETIKEDEMKTDESEKDKNEKKQDNKTEDTDKDRPARRDSVKK